MSLLRIILDYLFLAATLLSSFVLVDNVVVRADYVPYFIFYSLVSDKKIIFNYFRLIYLKFDNNLWIILFLTL